VWSAEPAHGLGDDAAASVPELAEDDVVQDRIVRRAERQAPGRVLSAGARGLLVGGLLVSSPAAGGAKSQSLRPAELIVVARVRGDNVSAASTGWQSQRVPPVTMMITLAVSSPANGIRNRELPATEADGRHRYRAGLTRRQPSCTSRRRWPGPGRVP
jgi:hypothetical protein